MADNNASGPAAATLAAAATTPADTQIVAAPAKPTGLAGMWAKYLKSLQKFPIRTKAFTSAIVSVVADLIAQKLGGGAFNLASLLKQFIIGLAVRGPVVHYWYLRVKAVKGVIERIMRLTMRCVTTSRRMLYFFFRH